MASFTLTRTVCCEGYKQCGRRYEICPNRPENRAAVLQFKQDMGCRLPCLRECGLKHPSVTITECAETTKFWNTSELP